MGGLTQQLVPPAGRARNAAVFQKPPRWLSLVSRQSSLGAKKALKASAKNTSGENLNFARRKRKSNQAEVTGK
jgi:hypothetical protein